MGANAGRFAGVWSLVVASLLVASAIAWWTWIEPVFASLTAIKLAAALLVTAIAARRAAREPEDEARPTHRAKVGLAFAATILLAWLGLGIGLCVATATSAEPSGLIGWAAMAAAIILAWAALRTRMTPRILGVIGAAVAVGAMASLVGAWVANRTIQVYQGTLSCGAPAFNGLLDGGARRLFQRPDRPCRADLSVGGACTPDGLYDVLRQACETGPGDLTIDVLNDWERLDPGFQRTLAPSPDGPEREFQAALRFRLALRALDAKDWAAAKAELKAALRLDPALAGDARAVLTRAADQRELFDETLCQAKATPFRAVRPKSPRDYEKIPPASRLPGLIGNPEIGAMLVAHELHLAATAAGAPVFALAPAGTVLTPSDGQAPVIVHAATPFVWAAGAPEQALGVLDLTVDAPLRADAAFVCGPPDAIDASAREALAPVWAKQPDSVKDLALRQWAVWYFAGKVNEQGMTALFLSQETEAIKRIRREVGEFQNVLSDNELRRIYREQARNKARKLIEQFQGAFGKAAGDEAKQSSQS